MTDQNTQFFAILTELGEAKLANANALGTIFTFTEMGVGDANGGEPVPDRSQTRLINERRRAPLNQLKPDTVDPRIIVAEQVIPAEVGGWWIREVGLYDAASDLVAIANCPPSYKPLLTQGSGRTQTVRMNLVVSGTASIELKIDPAVVLATRAYVDQKIHDEIGKLDTKQSARLATTGALTLRGLQKVDTKMAVKGDLILVKNQAAPSKNGLYVASAQDWVRASAADTSAEVTPNMLVSVEEGAKNQDTLWMLITDAPIVLETTGLAFEQIAGPTGIVPGDYRMVTVDRKGLVIAGRNPDTLAGHGITDAHTKAQAAKAFVHQGSGSGQLDNIIHIGWNGVNLLAQVDAIPLGNLWYSGNFDPSRKADVTQVESMIAALVSSSPEALDTLNELAAALGNDPNFATTMANALGGKMPVAGGAYSPRFAAVGFSGSTVGQLGMQGGYIGWNGGDGGLSGAMNFVCNRGGGSGGFTWRSVNANNTATGPIMTYSYDGTLLVPKAISTPEIVSNTLVPTQAGNDVSRRIANTEWVNAKLSAMAMRDGITYVGFASNDPGHPYMRRESDGQVYFLQPRLGFQPVQQGGGTHQTANAIQIGWDGSGIRCQVDWTDRGTLWDQFNFCRPDGNNFLGVMAQATSYTLPAGGTWCYALTHYLNDGRCASGRAGQAAGGTTITFSGGHSIYGFIWRWTT